MTEHVVVTPRVLASTLRTCLAARRPALVWGRRGVGKSSIVYQLASELYDGNVVELRGATLDPVDLRGLPGLDTATRETYWGRPPFLPADGRGILFIDEVNRAPGMVQNGLLQLALGRAVGDHRIGDDWDIIAAANPTGVGVVPMSDALTSRFIQLWLEPDLGDWCRWANAHGIVSRVIAFARFDSGAAMENPRGLEWTSDLLRQSPEGDCELPLVAGALGMATATKFMAFSATYRSLPNIDAILMAPSTADVPDLPALLYAVSAELARRATEVNLGRIIAYLDRMPSQEYSAFAIQSAVARDKVLASTPEMTRWYSAHSEYL